MDSKKRALLPKEHLSDFPSLSEKIYSLLVAHFESSSLCLPVEQVVILRSRLSSNDCRALVSMKRSLVEFALAFPSFPEDPKWSEWTANPMLPGFVERESLHKYLIGFTGNWKVWIDKNEWSLDGKLIMRTPRRHETVWCRLRVIDTEKKLTLWKPLDSSDTQNLDMRYSFYPTRYFDDLEQWKSKLLEWKVIQESIINREKLFRQGEIVAAQMVSKRPLGYVFSLKANDCEVKGVSLTEEEEISNETNVRILEYDVLSGFFLVYPVKDSYAQTDSQESKTSSTILPTYQSHLQGVVVLVKEDYLIMRLAEWNNLLVYFTCWDPRVRMNLSSTYSVDSVVKGIVYHSSERFIMLVPADSNMEKKVALRNVQIGDSVVGKVVRISAVHLHLFIPKYSAYGRIHCSQIIRKQDTNTSPLEHFEIGQELEAKVFAMSQSKGNSFLELTLNDMEKEGNVSIDWSHLSCRQCLIGFVYKILANKVLVSFSSQVIGVMKPCCFTENEKLLSSKQVFSSLRIGQSLPCTVIRWNESRKLLQVALSNLVKPIQVGDSIVAKVGQVVNGTQFSLQLPRWVKWSLHTCRGILSFTDVDDNFDRAVAKIPYFKSGKWIKVVIVDCTTCKEKPVVIVSVRNSDLQKTKDVPKDIRWKELAELKVGQLVRGFVRHHSSKGCFIQLSSNIVGRVMLRNLSDGFVQSIEETFPIGHLVTAKVIDVQNGQVELSLRESDLSDRETIFSVLQSGLRLQGTVKNIQSFGIFVYLGLGVTGFCHISTLEKQSKYQVGEVIWVQVGSVDREKGRISLRPLNPVKENGKIMTLTDLVGISFHKDSALQHSSLERDIHNDSIAMESSDESEISETENEVLQVSENFELQDKFLLENEGQERTNDVSLAMMADSEKERRLNGKDEQSDEEIELERSLTEPQNEEDFERHILSSPDDSSIWIRYMAYLINMRQVTN